MRWPILLALAACRTTGSPGGNVIAWQEPIEIAEGGGTKGPWQQNESRYDFVDDPSVALGADGATYVVWVDHRDKDVHFQIYGRDGKPRLARPANVSRNGATFSWLPRIVVAGEAVLVLWQEIIFSGGSHGGDILFARSTDGGATFEPAHDLSSSIAGDGKARITEKIWHNGSLDLALAPDGTLYAAWTSYEGALFVARSPDRGGEWSAPRQVTGSRERPARAPSLAVAADGTTFLAWTYGEDARADIHVAVSTGDGFGEPAIVASTPTYSDAPKLAVDRAGTLHVAWGETSGDAFASSRVQYTRSRDGARSFEPPRTLSRDEAAFPYLAVDGARILVVWEHGSAMVREARGLGFAASHDRGEHFTKPALIPGSRGDGVNGSQQGRLMDKLAARDAAVAVVNSSLDRGDDSRVWLIRGQLAELRASR